MSGEADFYNRTWENWRVYALDAPSHVVLRFFFGIGVKALLDLGGMVYLSDIPLCGWLISMRFGRVALPFHAMTLAVLGLAVKALVDSSGTVHLSGIPLCE